VRCGKGIRKQQSSGKHAKMKPFKVGVGSAILGLILLAVALGVWRDVSYWGELRAYKKTIRAHDLKIIGEWWYDEDFVLENFGVKVATETSKFWIDFYYPTKIQKADDSVAGIIVHHEEGVKRKVFPVESTFWKEKDLPMIKTFGDFLKYADVIAPKLQKANVRSYAYEEKDWDKFERYIFIRFNSDPCMPNQRE
jgi:hypothetical protein